MSTIVKVSTLKPGDIFKVTTGGSYSYAIVVERIKCDRARGVDAIRLPGGKAYGTHRWIDVGETSPFYDMTVEHLEPREYRMQRIQELVS